MIDHSYLPFCILAFVAMFGGALIGIFAARALPEHHLSSASASAVKLSTTIIVSLTSLVLALMLTSANSSFSINTGILKKLSSDLIHLDNILRLYGPEANEARTNLRAYATKKNEELFVASERSPTENREASILLDTLLSAILVLSPTDRQQTALVSQAQGITANLYAERWMLWENPGTTVPVQFLFVLIFWLFLIFLSFGIFAPVNVTVITSFFLSALAVTGAILLILELGDPMHRSWIQVSSDPLRNAILEIGRP
ncbi:MAG: hypothetical protein PSV46_23355 [Reyranella sp.]|nr:hypothetical protein [Reyranella sp.]